MNSSELAANRFLTQQFIAANPSVITLIPRTRVKTGSGVRWNEGPGRDPQVFRLIDQSSTSGPTPGTVTTGDGVQRRVEYQMLALHDADIGLYDTWVDEDGIRWQVAELLPDNDYERRAQVVRYGET